MFIISLIAVLLAGFFAKQEYDNNRIGWAMMWSGLIGWDIHSLLQYI